MRVIFAIHGIRGAKKEWLDVVARRQGLPLDGGGREGAVTIHMFG